MTDFAIQHLHARCVGDLKLKILSEVVSLPEGQRPRVLLIGTVGNEGITNPQGARHVTYQRREEIASGGRGSADDNIPKCFFRQMTFSDVMDESNNSDNLALSVAMRREDA